MVSSVTLGTFFTLSNGKTVLGGSGGSGLDTQALLTSLTDAKKLPATKDQDAITKNGKISAALTKFQSLLSAFQSSADALRNPPGVGNAADNVFKFTLPNVASPGNNYVSVTSAAGASLQSYQISAITSVASAARQGTGTFNVASADASVVGLGANPTFAAGDITFGGQKITIAAGDSLNNIAAKFNSVSSSTGVSASVIGVDANHYQLSFVAAETGDASNFDISAATDPDGVLTNAGITAPVSGTNAEFKLNGVPITRQSNSISDVIKDVTFNILQNTPDTTTPYTVAIQPDTSTIQNVINNFVSNYNAIKTFQAQQTQLNSDGTYADTALLANNQTFLTLSNNLNSQINGHLSNSGTGAINSLVDIGVTFTNTPATDTDPEVDNTLTINDGTLTSALQSNFAGVQKLFGFTLTADNPNLTIFTHTNTLAASAITLNIDGTAVPPVYQATYDLGNGPQTVDLTAASLGTNVSGVSLTGPAGSALEGLQLIYASNSPATIHVTLTQGIADKLYNTATGALTTNTGALAIEQKSITDANSRLNTDITNINQQVSVYQDQLVAKFSALEQAISKVNSLLSSLNANDTARTNAAQG